MVHFIGGRDLAAGSVHVEHYGFDVRVLTGFFYLTDQGTRRGTFARWGGAGINHAVDVDDSDLRIAITRLDHCFFDGVRLFRQGGEELG